MISCWIEIFRVDHGYSWRCHLSYGDSLRYDHRIETDWHYASKVSAEAAARRWCKRLSVGIEYVECPEDLAAAK